MKKIPVLIIAIFLSSAGLTLSAKNVAFFSSQTSSSDSNMIQMTTELFYSQLQSIEGFEITDKKEKTYTPEEAEGCDIAFYAVITEENDGFWLCTLNAIRTTDSKKASLTKKYPSYYKILLDAKSSLEKLFEDLENPLVTSSLEEKENSEEKENAEEDILDLEKLAGTWRGEKEIDKIVILRGGKGFVIFKNGASMNISLSITDDTVKITQNGRFNASFYPDLPRPLALQNAQSAAPIKWTFTFDGNSLSGTKTTLQEDKSSKTGASEVNLAVKWTKKY